MENFTDSVIHDERRYQAQCERADRLAALAETLTDDLMQPGEEFDPFTYEWLEEVIFERPTQMKSFCQFLREGDSLTASEVMKSALKDYVRPQAYAAALDRVSE